MSGFSLDFSVFTYFQPASTSNLEPKIQQHAGIAGKEALKCDFAELLSSKECEDLLRSFTDSCKLGWLRVAIGKVDWRHGAPPKKITPLFKPKIAKTRT